MRSIAAARCGGILYPARPAISTVREGGRTPQSRTFLTMGRLSEDIDIYSSDRRALCRELDRFPKLIKEEFPQANWNVMPSQTVDSQSSLLVCDSSIQIMVQVVDSRTREWSKVPKTLTQNARELIEELKGFHLSRQMMMGRVVGLWQEELAHQTKLDKSEDESLERLFAWWGER